MTYPTTLIVAALLCSTAAAAPQAVTCESPCSCSSAHGKGHWSVKNDPETPPTDTSTIQAVTPSDIFSWAGPVEHLTQSSERTGIENNWFALTGRVVSVYFGESCSTEATECHIQSTPGIALLPNTILACQRAFS